MLAVAAVVLILVALLLGVWVEVVAVLYKVQQRQQPEALTQVVEVVAGMVLLGMVRQVVQVS
jgi:hypothetical protein